MYGLIKKNAAQYLMFPLVDADGDYVSGATITGVFNYWEDDTAPQTSFSALTNAEVEIGSTGVYRVLLTAGETNHGYIAFMFTSGTSKPQLLLFRTTTGDPLALSVHAPADIWAVGTKVITGGALTTPNDYKATGFSVPNEYDTVIAALQTDLDNPNQYKASVAALALEATVAALNNITAASVWAVGTRELSGTIADFDALDAALDAAHGAGSWLTGGAGGATIQVIPSIPKNIDLSNTKLVRIALYLIDQNDDLPTTGEITPGTIKIERSADGGTSWSTIVNDEACLEHAGGIYYDEVFDSGAGYASADMIKITFKGQIVTISANDHEICDATAGMVFTTRIDSGLSGGGPSAGDIADAVWDEPIADHTTSSQFGGKNQKVVPSETINDYKASVAGLAPANEYDAELTAIQADLDSPAQYKATGFSVPNEYDVVIAALQTDLDNPNQYKATGFSVPNEYDAVIANLALEATVQAIKTLTDNLPANTETELLRLRGINGEFLVAEYTFVGDDNTVLELWQYDNLSNFNTHNKSTGLIGSWILNNTYAAGKPTIVKSKRLT